MAKLWRKRRGEALGTSVAGIARTLWGVQPELATERFAEPGWAYQEVVPRPCPECGDVLHTLCKPYESGGKQYQYVALVCPSCSATFTLSDLGLSTYDQLRKPPPAWSAAATVNESASSISVPAGPAVVFSTTEPASAAKGPASAAPLSDRRSSGTVAEVAQARWGVRPGPASERFSAPGWWYEEPAPLPCPACDGQLHALRKVYDGPKSKPGGKPSLLVAVVCPACPATFTLRDLDLRSYAALMGGQTTPQSPHSDRADAARIHPGRSSAATSSSVDCDVPPGEMRVRTIRVPASRAREFATELLAGAGPEMFSPRRMPQPAAELEPRLLHWCKLTNPDVVVPTRPDGVDVRVLLPLAPKFAGLCARLDAAGVPYRQVRYWLETETISTVGEGNKLAPLRVKAELPLITNSARHRSTAATGWHAAAARDAYEMLWDTYAQPPDASWAPVDAADLVPEAWLPYLPYSALNPAQAQAAPAVLGTRGHVVVTAPTGAGKTMIGMFAALKAILVEHRKAAWLVPQRSLTDELDRELAIWRRLGLRVERLSGEYVTDVQKVREADLWVATTEKFEAICRATSLRAALAEVNCLVVDEIHLLGEAGRGPLLEALLARVRGDESPVRIVGLSATAANAGQIAEWLGARLEHITWRPSRLTWQLPLIPATSDRHAGHAARMQITTAITTMITQDGGSVLVFCGTKRNVRATALAIAAARSTPAHRVDPDDLPRLHQVCRAVGVGIHYKDWEYKRQAERGFRDRELDVLVATTTVAAGVNLPARAVVVRDTEIGVNELNVATVQQMFGRAGRIGAGETEGWAYLVTDETERPVWQARLIEGFTVTSHIADSLADHILAEAAQDRISTQPDAENWWMRMLAYHQGTRDLAPVQAAIEFLIEGGYLTPVTQPGNITLLRVTELGMLTTRLMVPVVVGANLRAALASETVPDNPDKAEELLGNAIATLVPQLAEAPITDDVRPFVARLLRARGRLDQLDSVPQSPGLAPVTACYPGDLARVAFALVAKSPYLFSRHRRMIEGVPSAILHPILDEAPRYFAWLTAQGQLGTVHPWIAVVAGDLGRRIRWRRLAPIRGAGRLLWMCEQMATPPLIDTLVPDLFTAARRRDITDPDWPVGRPPRRCQLDPSRYLALLRDRATDTAFIEDVGNATITYPNAATVAMWTGRTHQATQQATAGTFRYPTPHEDGTHPKLRGATIFTRRGDYYSVGWLETYNTI